MAKIVEVTNEKGLQTALRGIVTSMGTVAVKLQACINFAGAHFNKCGDTCHFVTVLDAVVNGNVKTGRGKKVVNTSHIKAYLELGYALEISANGDGKHSVRKNKTDDVVPNVAVQAEQWNEWNKPKVDKPDFDLEQLKKYLKSKAEATKGVDAETMKAAALCFKTIVKQQAR